MDNLPSNLGINSAVAVRNDIAHGFDFSPRDRIVTVTEIFCQLADQLTNLKNTERSRIAVNCIGLEGIIAVAKSLDGLITEYFSRASVSESLRRGQASYSSTSSF